jgi:hypothetical protein
VVNFLRLKGEPPEKRAERLAAKLTHEQCWLLVLEFSGLGRAKIRAL